MDYFFLLDFPSVFLFFDLSGIFQIPYSVGNTSNKFSKNTEIPWFVACFQVGAVPLLEICSSLFGKIEITRQHVV